MGIGWLWTVFTDLTWWQMTLWIAYTIYFVVRSCMFWGETEDTTLWNGYKRAMFGHDKYFRVYHVVKVVFDIPPAILGLFFPILRALLSFKLYEFKIKK